MPEPQAIPKQPLTGELVTNDVLASVGTNPTGFSGADNPSAAWRLMLGDSPAAYALYRDLEEKDGQVSSALETRKDGVLRRERKVIAASATADGERRAAFAREVLAAIPNFENILYELLDAAAYGVAVAEILWEQKGGTVFIRDIKPRPQELFAFGAIGEPQVGPLRFAQRTARQSLGEGGLPEHKFLVYSFRPRHGNRRGRPLLRRVFWASWFKRQDLKFWLKFIEKGTGSVVVRYPAGATDQDKQRALEAAEAINAETAVAIPENFQIVSELLNAARAGDTDVFLTLADSICNNEIARVILGQTLTQRGAEDGRGSRALGEVHQEVRFEKVAADARDLMSGGTAKFVVPIRSIDSETQATLDYDPQGADKSWPGDSNGSSYRIYKCALIETINFAGGSITHASGGTTDWAATDTLEVPLGWAWYGGNNIIVQNYLPGFSVYGLNITNSGSDEALTRVLSMSSGKAALGLVFDNTWECQANNVNCNSAGFTTGIRFQNPPTVGLHYATTVSGPNEVLRLNDQFSGATGNVRVFYSTTADGWSFEHAASTANVIQLFPSNGSMIATIYSTRSYHDFGGVAGTVPGSGLLRVRSGNGGTPILTGRNQANSANVTLLTYSTSDRLQLTQSGTPVEFVGGIASDGGGFKHRRVSTGSCATSGCQVTVSWTTAFADTNYTATCSVVDSTAQSETTGLRLAKINTLAAGSVTVDVDNLSGSAITGTVHCVAIHD